VTKLFGRSGRNFTTARNIHGWHMKSDVRNVAVATDRLEINDVINICKYNGTERVFS
jgi:transcription antitermination factor NusA-like protein